jgi:membrane fusion protein (multidrug efflux system)
MKAKNVVYLALLVVAVLLVAYFAPKFGQGDAAAAQRTSSSAPAKPTPVEVYEVVPERISETLIAPGTLVANERIDVVSEVAGTISQILFSEGARVAAGDVLVKIDDRELVAGRDRIKARLELAERRSKRQKELHDQGLISDDERETAETEVDALRAELAQLEVRLDKTEIRAPFSGVVGLRRVSDGAYLSPQTRITTLVDNDPMKLEFSVPERYSDRFGPGDVVTFQAEGAGAPRKAKVYAIEPLVDPETRTVPMRAEANNSDGRLVPGGFADVILAVREVNNALAVPSIAVISELGGKKVFVVEAGVVQPRQVEAGIRTDDRVQITSGLEAGDQVVVSGLQFLRPGLSVEVTTAPESPASEGSTEPASAEGTT